MKKNRKVPGAVALLLPVFLFVVAVEASETASARAQCAALRLALHQHIGARSNDLFVVRADRNRDWWLDPYVADVAFRDLTRMVMYFDHAYERVGMGPDADAQSCYALALDYGQQADAYVDALLSSRASEPQ